MYGSTVFKLHEFCILILCSNFNFQLGVLILNFVVYALLL